MGPADFFPSTRWSEVQAGAAGAGSEALEGLARNYSEPIRAWLRHALRLDEEQASDVTQEFFLWILPGAGGRDLLSRADPSPRVP